MLFRLYNGEIGKFLFNGIDMTYAAKNSINICKLEKKNQHISKNNLKMFVT